MIRGFAVDEGRLRQVAGPLEAPDNVVWFDVVAPEPAEEAALEALLGFNVPTREEMEEIEESSRYYLADGTAYLTATLPARTDDPVPGMVPVTFVLSGDRLVTLRYDEPRVFQTFPPRAEKVALGCTGGETVLLALLDAIVDRLADLLEGGGREIEAISRSIFRHVPDGARRGPDFRSILEQIGRQGDLVSNVADSLVTVERLVAFLTLVSEKRTTSKESRGRMKSLARDTRFLAGHAGSLSQKVTFLLDATLGMISIEQNAIIKIFSVAAVIFLPPTLVASIYGMNFHVMPELDWLFGYPFALGLMVLSAVLSYWVFKRQGWL
jgi:magnesium transporter